jgi:hypothetical protein
MHMELGMNVIETERLRLEPRERVEPTSGSA